VVTEKGACFEPLRLPGAPDEPQCVVKSGAVCLIDLRIEPEQRPTIGHREG
jgi:hypothetical protein